VKPKKKKKSQMIGEAVFRGKKNLYNFEVFPLGAEFEDAAAIYVISKRINDKQGRGHHKFVCIGQTESVLGDIKKHAKGKCIKQNMANVICILAEADEKNRRRIEADLRESHRIACNHK
jgi:hypothetical protein